MTPGFAAAVFAAAALGFVLAAWLGPIVVLVLVAVMVGALAIMLIARREP